MKGVTANNIGNHGTMAAVGGKKAKKKPFVMRVFYQTRGKVPQNVSLSRKLKTQQFYKRLQTDSQISFFSRYEEVFNM